MVYIKEKGRCVMENRVTDFFASLGLAFFLIIVLSLFGVIEMKVIL